VMAATGQAVVVTVFGDRIVVADLALEKGRLRVDSPMLGRAELPMQAVREIYLPTGTEAPAGVEARYRKMKLPDAASDRLLVDRKGTEPIAVDGVLERIDPANVTIQWKGQSRQVARSSVRLIRLAAAGSTRPAARAGVVVGRRGSTVPFTSVTVSGKSVTLTSLTLGARQVSLDEVAAVRFISDRLVDLAALEPAATREYGFFNTTFHYRANRSAAGGPLMLGRRRYRSGLGLHSFCELTYQLDAKYRTFVATAGIDDVVRPHGDALVTFLANGKPLGKPLHLTGTGAPQTIRLPLEGVRKFVIRVDFGKDGLDFADHVDLVAARLIK
jgi:hypothetical protein